MINGDNIAKVDDIITNFVGHKIHSLYFFGVKLFTRHIATIFERTQNLEMCCLYEIEISSWPYQFNTVLHTLSMLILYRCDLTYDSFYNVFLDRSFPNLKTFQLEICRRQYFQRNAYHPLLLPNMVGCQHLNEVILSTRGGGNFSFPIEFPYQIVNPFPPTLRILKGGILTNIVSITRSQMVSHCNTCQIDETIGFSGFYWNP